MIKDGLLENLPSIVIGSIIAGVLVGIILDKLNRRQEKRRKKQEIFEILIKTKNYNDINNVHSLNLIPIVFKKNDKVVHSFRLLVKEANKNSFELNSYKFAYNDLITQIGRDIGYYSKCEYYSSDIEYLPKWVDEYQKFIVNQQEIAKIEVNQRNK